MKKTTLFGTAAVVSAVLLWQTVSMAVGNSLLLASPLQVAKRLCTLWLEKGFFSTVLFSLLRILLGFAAALAAGTLLAILSGRFGVAEILLKPYIVTAQSVPVASFIILCLIWFSYKQLTVFIAFLIAFPVIYSNVLQGIKSTDRRMIEAADLYGVPWSRRLLYVYLPAIKPFLLSAGSVSAGMAWKAGIAAEVIGVVKGSVGERLYDAKIYFSNADLLAWTVIIIIMSVATEKLVTLLLRAAFGGVERL